MTGVRIRVQTRTAWAMFIIRVANRLFDWHLSIPAMLWLWALQKAFVIGVWVEGSYHRFLWLRWRKWSYKRIDVSVAVSASRKHEMPSVASPDGQEVAAQRTND